MWVATKSHFCFSPTRSQLRQYFALQTRLTLKAPHSLLTASVTLNQTKPLRFRKDKPKTLKYQAWSSWVQLKNGLPTEQALGLTGDPAAMSAMEEQLCTACMCSYTHDRTQTHHIYENGETCKKHPRSHRQLSHLLCVLAHLLTDLSLDSRGRLTVFFFSQVG